MFASFASARVPFFGIARVAFPHVEVALVRSRRHCFPRRYRSKDSPPCDLFDGEKNRAGVPDAASGAKQFDGSAVRLARVLEDNDAHADFVGEDLEDEIAESDVVFDFHVAVGAYDVDPRRGFGAQDVARRV